MSGLIAACHAIYILTAMNSVLDCYQPPELYHQSDTQKRCKALAERYRMIRHTTESLCEPLEIEDFVAQSMEGASPIKWHIAHTSWFFEMFVISEAVGDYKLFNDDFRSLFNSYYVRLGEQFSRSQRGVLTRPTVAEVLDYRAHVDEKILNLLEIEDHNLSKDLLDKIELGLNHEQQHQELIITDLKHLWSHNPLTPVYSQKAMIETASAPALKWRRFSGGLETIGYNNGGFCFDNETPRHSQFIAPFALASRPVTCGEYIEFIEDGGYSCPELWLSEGWSALNNLGWQAPLYWYRDKAGHWSYVTLSGKREVNANEPVCHVSYFEADAFARWCGARLPREAEWEVSASQVEVAGNFLNDRLFQPSATYKNGSTSFDKIYGDCWEWTNSPYTPYPGFETAPGAIGEYNAKFMCNQYVLRGGSCATAAEHIRSTYRNFFGPQSRWQFSGIRLARDI